MIELKKCSTNLSTLFEEYLEESSKPKYNYYGGYDYYDDWDDDYDYYGTIFHGVGYDYDYKKKVTGSTYKSNKRGKRGGKKKGKSIPLYDVQTIDLYDSDEVTIYFYRDINNPDDKEIFYNLYEFNEFLDSEGIYISDYETKQLLNRNISHCCIDPSLVSLKGTPWLLSDSSFGGLSWSVCGDTNELLSQESMLSKNNDGLPF